MYYVLIDNGHGYDTPGKCSPKLDNGTRYYEWKYTRLIAFQLYKLLKNEKNITPILVTPEENDISLTTRANRINSYCDKYGTKNCMLISIHSNASGNGDWMNAHGWSVYTTRGTTKSDQFATCLWEAASDFLGKDNVRSDYQDGDPDYEANYTIIFKSKCVAVLTENMFHDNKDDVEFLMSLDGIAKLSQIHYEGILDYVQIKEKEA